MIFLMLVLCRFYLVTFCVLEAFDNSFISFTAWGSNKTLQYIFCCILFILDYAYRNEYLFLTKSEFSVPLSVYWKKYNTVKSGFLTISNFFFNLNQSCSLGFLQNTVTILYSQFVYKWESANFTSSFPALLGLTFVAGSWSGSSHPTSSGPRLQKKINFFFFTKSPNHC